MSGAPRLQSFVAMGATVVLASCAAIAKIDDFSASGGQSPPGSGGLALSTSELTLPELRCGAEASASITVSNDHGAALDYEAVLPAEAPFVFGDGSTNVVGRLEPHGSVELTVRARTDRPGEFTAEMIVTSNEGVQQAKVRAIVKGAELTITPSLLDFGDVRQNTDTDPQSVTITNTGNEPVEILGFEGPSTEFELPAEPITVAPDQTATVPVTLRRGPAGDPVVAEVVPKTSAATCGAPAKLLLKGTRVSRDVLVSPLTASFGEVACKSQTSATARVVVSNYGPQAVAAHVAVPEGSWFTVTPATFTVPKGSADKPATYDIVIGLKPLDERLGKHVEDITVTVVTDPPATSVIKAEVDNVGAVLDVTPASLDVGSGSRDIKVVNRGNKGIWVRHTSSDDDFTVESNYFLLPSFYATPKVSLATQNQGQFEATIQTTRGTGALPPSGALCNSPTLVRVKGSRSGGGGGGGWPSW